MARFGVRSDRSLLELLKELPEGSASAVRSWFDALSRIDGSAQGKVISDIVEAYERDEFPSAEIISRELSAAGLRQAQTDDLAHGMRMMALLLSARDDSVEDFITAAKQANMIDDRQEQATATFAKTIISQRASIAETIERSRLADVVLPSVISVDYSVDIRIEVIKGLIERAVPIAVLRIDTDTYKEELFFQLRKSQLAQLIKELQDAHDQIEVAERWISTRP